MMTHNWSKGFSRALLKSIIVFVMSLAVSLLLMEMFYSSIIRMVDEVRLPLMFSQHMELESYTIRMQISLLLGFVISLPYLMYFVAGFLKGKPFKIEMQWIPRLVAGATGSFIVGAALAYYLIIPFLLRNMANYLPAGESPFTVGELVAAIWKLTILCGFLFEMPVAAFYLIRTGMLTHTWLTANRKIAIILVFILSSLLTPPDPVSQVILAAPLILIYEIAVLISRSGVKKPVISV